MVCKFRYKGADLAGSLIPRPPLLKISLRKGRSRLRWVSQLMKQGWREWDEQVLKRCMYPHDVEEVLKICLTDWREEDCLAWFHERSSIFTVRSAYKLALRLDKADRFQEGSSTRQMAVGHCIRKFGT
jgi:hypothetical protein